MRQTIGFVCLFLMGCGDVPGWQARRDQRAAELVAREQQLLDVASYQRDAASLREQVEPLVFALTQVPVAVLAAALVEHQATGYLEEQGDKKRVVMEGPGGADRAAAALALAADRVPGLRIDEVDIAAGHWKVVARTENPPAMEVPTEPAPGTGLRTGALEEETAALVAQIHAADEKLGTPLPDYERQARLLTWAKARIGDGQRLLNFARLLGAAGAGVDRIKSLRSRDGEPGLLLVATFADEASAQEVASSWKDGVSVRGIAQKGAVLEVKWGASG